MNDVNAPRDIQGQEYEQNGSRHFADFRPHFHINMTSQTQSCRTIKMKVQYLRRFC